MLFIEREREEVNELEHVDREKRRQAAMVAARLP